VRAPRTSARCPQVCRSPVNPGREEAGRRRAKRHRGRGRPRLDSRYREPFLDAMGESPRDPGARCAGWYRPALRGWAPRRAPWPSRSRPGFRDGRSAPAVRSVARGHRREIENAPFTSCSQVTIYTLRSDRPKHRRASLRASVGSRARHGACGAGGRARVGGDPRPWPLRSRGSRPGRVPATPRMVGRGKR